MTDDDYEHELALWWSNRSQQQREQFSQQARDKNDRHCLDVLTIRERIKWAERSHHD